MQFNSYLFILAFLPLTIICFFLAGRISALARKLVLVCASIIFCACNDTRTLAVLLCSVLINYAFTLLIKKCRWRKLFLALPIIINVSLLLYFKYSNFFILNLSYLLRRYIEPLYLFLPVGISFFTFQQIAYLVAAYRNELPDGSFLDYLVYILYFPKLLMGPLAEPVDFIAQLNAPDSGKLDLDHLAEGLKIFSFGLLKKVLLADTFAKAVNWGFNNTLTASSLDWLLIMLFYTFQIYFDFSGYSDMAVGVSRMLNISLPINFDSPYKALSIRDFWKRWHMSLTSFLTKYVYIPLGGSRKGRLFTYINTMIVFLVSGIWHGANWTFILWGILHGLFSIFDRLTEKYQAKVFQPVRWMLTFLVINILWLLFRAESIMQWRDILERAFSFQNMLVSNGLIASFIVSEESFFSFLFHLGGLEELVSGFWMLVFTIVSFGICLVPENNYRTLEEKSIPLMLIAAIALVWGVISLGGESIFIYSNF